MEERFNKILGFPAITGLNLSLDADPIATRFGISTREVKEQMRKDQQK